MLTLRIPDFPLWVLPHLPSLSPGAIINDSGIGDTHPTTLGHMLNVLHVADPIVFSDILDPAVLALVDIGLASNDAPYP